MRKILVCCLAMMLIMKTSTVRNFFLAVRLWSVITISAGDNYIVLKGEDFSGTLTMTIE